MTIIDTQQQQQQSCCGVCHYPGSDVRLENCGCTLHARCVPLCLLATKSPATGILRASDPHTQSCPCCHTIVSAIYLFPLSLAELDRAVHLKKQSALEGKAGKESSSMSSSSSTNDNGKRGRSHSFDDEFLQVQAESSYLLLSHSQTSTGNTITEADFLRTGRWTDEEILFVDSLVSAFDAGQLLLPCGVRLNDFLRDILLCKASRLTKKMKNAKLSSRSYVLKPDGGSGRQGAVSSELLSSLQESFLSHITQESAQLELRFNVTKSWRLFLSNLCIQLGSTILDANDWVVSLEQMEARATMAEEMIRKARRKRMGLALKKDMKATPEGVLFSGGPMGGEGINGITRPRSASSATAPPKLIEMSLSSTMSGANSDEHNFEDSLIASMLDMGTDSSFQRTGQYGQTSDDIASLFHDFDGIGQSGRSTSPLSSCTMDMKNMRNNCGPFLEAIVTLMEQHNLPFQHVDVWVPSFLPATSSSSQTPARDAIRLFHAGHATRSDIDMVTSGLLQEYGEYSTHFTFASGVGLPGRIYEHGQPGWERFLGDTDPQQFKRAGGAKVYGVQTGLGLALSTGAIGRLVVVLYSTLDLVESARIVRLCQEELAKFRPEPKWKLVVEMGRNDNNTVASSLSAISESSTTLPGFGQANKNNLATVFRSFQSFATPQISHYCHGRTDGSSSGEMNSFPSPLQSKSVSSDAALQYQCGSPLSSMAPPFSMSSLGGTNTLASDPYEEEQRIATLLGDHIPLDEISSSEQGVLSSSTTTINSGMSSKILVPLFMSLRLLLLRNPSRRTDEDNEIIEVIRKSYRGYSNDQRRSDKEVVFLLVKDFHFLKMSKVPAFGDEKKALSEPVEMYQSHVMGLPSVNTYSSTGAPQRMPHSLPFMDPSKICRGYYGETLSQSQNGVTMAYNPIMPSHDINFVDED